MKCECCCKKGTDGEWLLNESGIVSNDDIVQVKWKPCLLWSCLSCALFWLVFLLLLFLVIIPEMAQHAANNQQMTQESALIWGFEEDSIRLNATIRIANNGQNRADVPKTLSTVASKWGKIGTMWMPSIRMEPNKDTLLNISAKLEITNQELLDKSLELLMAGTAIDLFVISKPKVSLHVAGSIIKIDLSLNNSMHLIGSKIEDAEAGNMTIISAGKNTLNAKADMALSIASNVMLQGRDLVFEIRHPITKVTVGYTRIDEVQMNPGYNFLQGIPTILNRSKENEEVIGEFMGNYMQGKNQRMHMFGPVPYYRKTCIDGIIHANVTILGGNFGDTAIAGLLTEQSQNGWSFNITVGNRTEKYTARGGYATMYNPLNVPFRIIDMSADIDLWYGFAWDVVVGQGIFKQTIHCNYTTKFGHMYTGPGMWQGNYSKTWVDFGAHEYQSAFFLGGPQNGQAGWPNSEPDVCTLLTGFPCCYATQIVGAICYENQVLSKNVNHELENVFISAKSNMNMTIVIDKQFKITMPYHQDFFPLLYGYSVYAGFSGDGGLTCSDYTFYTPPPTMHTTGAPTPTPLPVAPTPSPTEYPTPHPTPKPTMSPTDPTPSPTPMPTDEPTTPAPTTPSPTTAQPTTAKPTTTTTTAAPETTTTTTKATTTTTKKADTTTTTGAATSSTTATTTMGPQTTTTTANSTDSNDTNLLLFAN